MRNLYLLLVVLLAACSKKTASLTKNETKDKQVEVCNFGLNQFNKLKRPVNENPYVEMRSPHVNPSAAEANATILLDFGGERVANTLWNTAGEIICAPANLQASEIEKILLRVSEDFAPFNVMITTDESVFNNTDPLKRVRIIITETWEWFGVAGGVAYPGSFSWGNNTPAFVFSTLLFYNEKFIAEAISHEAGHTLGLAHQRSLSANCALISEYHEGMGNGLTGWAPIMGNGYYHNLTTWHKGTTTSCGSIQDDVSVIATVLGLKSDELDKMNRAPVLMQESEGMINSVADEDYFSVHLKKAGTLEASPHCLGNGIGANMQLKMNIYGPNGKLISTVSDPQQLSVITQLPAGKYYVGIQNTGSGMNYGMLGRYSLKLL